MRRTALSCFVLLALFAGSAAEKKLPPPPADNWLHVDMDSAQATSLDPAHPFGFTGHLSITPSGEVCSNELVKAIYRQDVLHAFESRAHVDNCAFDDSVQYIDALQVEAGRHFAAAGRAKHVDGKVQQQVLDGMLALGQALHAIQDFYAHSNYVELMEAATPPPASESELPIVPIWEQRGRAGLATLRAKGLVSGRVWWSTPHRCVQSVALHSDLAKDSPTMPAGKAPSIWTPIGRSSKIANYTIAVNIAGRATREYLRSEAQRFPVIRRECGDALAFEVLPDRRNDVPEEP